MPNLRIRPEEPRDIPQLRALAHAAFGRDDEARLLNRLRAEGALLLSHVALLNDELVGQAAYSLVSVDDGAHEHFMVAALDDVTPGSARGHVRFHSAFAEA